MSQLKDSSPSSKQASTVKYQGRKTSRAGSEQRRRLILEAALRIVIREGVRGIRHRAVAKAVSYTHLTLPTNREV